MWGVGWGWGDCEPDHESETIKARRLEATVPMIQVSQQIGREKEKGMEGMGG